VRDDVAPSEAPRVYP